MKSISEIVLGREQDYIYGSPVRQSKYVDFDMYETISTIEAYLNSKHISGLTDEFGREKPFFNIVVANSNIWYRATDIDRKNIRFKADTSKEVIAVYIANILLQNYMKRDNFGKWLNDWGRTLSRYGSCVSKHVKKNGKLTSVVVPWSRLICDPVDFYSDVVIETMELTPADLRKNKAYNQEYVRKLIETADSRELLNKEKQDDSSNYIKLYEVHGELPLAFLTGNDEDNETYVQQMHVVSFNLKEVDGKKEVEEFCLYKGKEAKNPYRITHLIEEEGRTLSIGSVEYMFDAQWMQNHTVKAIKDQLDLASKIVYQTSDGNFIGQNALNNILNGDILIHSPNEPLTQVNMGSHDIVSLQNFGNQWKVLGNEITGSSESLMGQNPPSGTAWRQTEALLQESYGLFELMTENKGLALEEIIREFVLDDIISQMDSTEEISAIIEDNDIKFIDARYIKAEATKRAKQEIKDKILNGEEIVPVDIEALQGQVQAELQELGNKRFFKPSEISTKTWKEAMQDFKWNVDIEITGEQKDKQSVLTTLTTVLQTIARNPLILQDPTLKMLFNKILMATGELSPIELTTVPTATPQAVQQNIQSPIQPPTPQAT